MAQLTGSEETTSEFIDFDTIKQIEIVASIEFSDI